MTPIIVPQDLDQELSNRKFPVAPGRGELLEVLLTSFSYKSKI
jgi:hypothetical protein